MTYAELNDFCGSLAATTHITQWGGSEVWKVGGKVFAIGGWKKSEEPAFTFKTQELYFEILKDEPGFQPAPYMAARGMKWIQHFEAPGLDDAALKEHIKASYHMAIKRLTKKKRLELGV